MEISHRPRRRSVVCTEIDADADEGDGDIWRQTSANCWSRKREPGRGKEEG